MVITTTRWSPDTCSCELEYDWDTDENENVRKHNFAKIVRVCSAHSAIVPANTTNLAQLKKIYDTVVEENTRKNQALGRALQVRPELADIIDNTGNRHDLVTVAKQMKAPNPQKAAEDLGLGVTLKENISYRWRWLEPKGSPDAPRTLEIDFETPMTIEDAIAVKSTNPSATQEQIQQQTRKRLTGDTPDTLQQALDSEFTREKGRGQVKVKGL